MDVAGLGVVFRLDSDGSHDRGRVIAHCSGTVGFDDVHGSVFADVAEQLSQVAACHHDGLGAEGQCEACVDVVTADT